MDRQFILSRGQRAQRLLEDPAFAQVYTELTQDFQTELFSTSTEQAQQREDLYYQHRALQTILALLRTHVHEAQRLLTEAEVEDASDFDEDFD